MDPLPIVAGRGSMVVLEASSSAAPEATLGLREASESVELRAVLRIRCSAPEAQGESLAAAVPGERARSWEQVHKGVLAGPVAEACSPSALRAQLRPRHRSGRPTGRRDGR